MVSAPVAAAWLLQMSLGMLPLCSMELYEELNSTVTLVHCTLPCNKLACALRLQVSGDVS